MDKKIKPPNNKKEKSMTKMIGWVFTNEADAKGSAKGTPGFLRISSNYEMIFYVVFIAVLINLLK